MKDPKYIADRYGHGALRVIRWGRDSSTAIDGGGNEIVYKVARVEHTRGQYLEWWFEVDKWLYDEHKLNPKEWRCVQTYR